MHNLSSLQNMEPFLVIDELLTSSVDMAVDLDLRTLGGLWTREHYLCEIQRPQGLFLGLLTDIKWEEKAPSLDPPTQSPRENHDPSLALTLIGMASLWGITDEAHITLLVVDSEYQKQYMGTLLLNRLLVGARALGLARSTLEVRQSNHAAIRLYESFQFQCLGERRNYYADGETGLIYWLKGLQGDQYWEFLCDQKNEILKEFQQKGYRFADKFRFSAP